MNLEKMKNNIMKQIEINIKLIDFMCIRKIHVEQEIIEQLTKFEAEVLKISCIKSYIELLYKIVRQYYYLITKLG